MLKNGSPAFATLPSLSRRFTGILRGGRADPLDAWIDNAIESNLISIMLFARTLHREIDAVQSALELPWSNGQAEGSLSSQINKEPRFFSMAV